MSSDEEDGFTARPVRPERVPLQRSCRTIIRIRPRQVLFLNQCISEYFSCGRRVADVARALRTGELCPAALPRIAVVRRPGDGRLLTLNHRRLYALQRGVPEGEEVEAYLLDDGEAVNVLPPDRRGYAAVYVDKGVKHQHQ